MQVRQSLLSLRCAALVLALSVAPLANAAVAADATSPVGRWKTIDDDTGKPMAIVHIEDSNGILTGRIEKLFREPGEEQNPLCGKCDGTRKDQPITGMTIIWDLKRDGEEYDGGKVIDPANGTIYSAKVSVSGDGKKLSMRGFVGFSLFGRTQTWLRTE